MEFWTKRVGSGLYVYDADSADEFAKVPWSKPLKTVVTQPRNIDFHRLFFALCKRVGQGIGKDTDWVVWALKVETGHYTLYKTIGGREGFRVESIAWDVMDEIRFRSFFNECVEIIYTKWGIDPASVADLLLPKGMEESRR